MFAASKTAAAAPTDPDFNYVTMLLHGDGTNGAQNNTFLDSSTNNFTITRNGTPTQGSFSPYGDLWSNFFSGTAQYLTTSSVTFAGDFTVEGWVFIVNLSAARAMVQIGDNLNANGPVFYVTTAGKFSIYAGSPLLAGSATIAANTWVHLAVCRSGSTVKSYVNGVLDATITNSTTFTGAVRVGVEWFNGVAGGVLMNGYISNLRLVTGTAIYTSTFTPSTTPLTAVSGTSLLTCQSNRFIDNSSNNFTLTRTGTPSVQRFSPFDPAAAYSTSVIGGSGYFNGTDYLTFTGITFNGDFCAECWYYRTANPTNYSVLFGGGPSSGVTNHQFYVGNTGSVSMVLAGVSIIASVGTAAGLNTWNHIAYVRSGSNCAIFVNGVRQGTATSATNTSICSKVGDIANLAGYRPIGYVSNARIVIGSSVYDPTATTLTVPTAPLTAITNTSLLLNTINAGIFDNAMMNDLVTVGNAQVSTAVVKFGTGSMKFDGTGDWLTFNDTPNVQLGTGNFTIEGWVYLSALGSVRGFFSKGTSTTGISLGVNALNQLVFNYTASSLTATTVLVISTWYHVAVVRNGTATGNVKIYLNGTADATSGGAINDNFNQTSIGYIGADRTGASPMNGYIDDLRISKGIARYTAAFTPPTAAFPNN